MPACAIVKGFKVCTVNAWSDHAPLVLKMLVPDTLAVVNLGREYLSEKIKEAWEKEKRKKFFGPVAGLDTSGLKVYTDGSCFENGSDNAHAGMGVYFGLGNESNISLRVMGDQTNNRGELLAVLYCVSTAKPYKHLDIYSDSEYAIRSIVYWGPDHAEAGWKCANSDLLQDILSWIHFRTTPVHLPCKGLMLGISTMRLQMQRQRRVLS
ncbi:ribonuclease H-like domain-containing protein [Mycena latifolia]|nr:ribonuclease H-like domain-containing protein [Mycena latifolia]